MPPAVEALRTLRRAGADLPLPREVRAAILSRQTVLMRHAELMAPARHIRANVLIVANTTGRLVAVGGSGAARARLLREEAVVRHTRVVGPYSGSRWLAAGT